MRAKVAVLLVLFTSSSPAFSQLVGTQDVTVGGLAAGAASIVYSQNKIESINRAIELEAGQFESDIRQQSSEMNKLLSEAKMVEEGKPNAQSRSLYTGEYIKAAEYEKYAGEEKQMKSNKYRLQTDGATKIADALLKENALKGQDITLTLHRVNGNLDGTTIRMGQPTTLNGRIEDIAKKLVEAASAQSPTQAPGSIVAVELEYKTFDKPNPEAATKIRSRAQSISEKIEAKKKQVQPQVDAVHKKYSAALKTMKTLRTAGIAAIPASIVFGFVRYSFAQNMITLAKACADEDQLNTLTTSVSVQTDLNEDDVAYSLREICAQ